MTDPSLVEELMRMFADGATPSRLIQHVAARFPDDPRLPSIVIDSFFEAFGTPLVRSVSPDTDYSPAKRHAHFNRMLLPEMCLAGTPLTRSPPAKSWLEGISVRPRRQIRQATEETCGKELGSVWNEMTPSQRMFVVSAATSKQYDYEAMKCMAGLMERLQEKVVALEARLEAAGLAESRAADERTLAETAGIAKAG